MAPGPAPRICILGTRGIPARHGGFETFAERLALHLVARGWEVEVFCQCEGGEAAQAGPDTWNGVRLTHVKVRRRGAAGSVMFDAVSLFHALRRPGALLLTLGYNTACFAPLPRLLGRANLINMDGIEWRRTKWPRPIRAWFWVNERLACLFGTHLVADHPAIADHLATRVRRGKVTVIPYGGEPVETGDSAVPRALGVEPGSYALVIARTEPENSLREIVSAFSARPRGRKLVVLGSYLPDSNGYHRAVMDAAGPDVLFPGAIYEAERVAALRAHARLYVHGHQVGGTNPSLVEAMGAGCPLLVHDNPFNRWVAGPRAGLFTDGASCAEAFDAALARSDAEVAADRAASRARHAEHFTWPDVLARYEALLSRWAVPGSVPEEAPGLYLAREATMMTSDSTGRQRPKVTARPKRSATS